MNIEPRPPVHTSRRMRVVRSVAVAVIGTIPIAAGVGEAFDEPTAAHIEEPTAPPRALFGTPGERFMPGTYFVDEVDGSPTPRIYVTIGEGWSNHTDGWGIGKDDTGFITFSRPDFVFSDACRSGDGYHPGPVTTLDGLVAALNEQGGWVDVSALSDIAVDGYVGHAFQRTAPAEFSDCSTSSQPFRGWEYEDGSLSYYEAGETETLWVLDVDGTVVVINTRMLPEHRPTAPAELAAVLDFVRIDPPTQLSIDGAEPDACRVDIGDNVLCWV